MAIPLPRCPDHDYQSCRAGDEMETAVAVDPSWRGAASLPGVALKRVWRSVWGLLLQGRGGEENPLEASIKEPSSGRWMKPSKGMVDGVSRSALAGAVAEMEVALKEAR